ncbi:MAG: hypothetical protein U0183_06810 [Polyangiaceae bacterium]
MSRPRELPKSGIAIVLATVAVIAPSRAFGDAGADAQDLFVRARELRAEGKCADAIPLFRKANELAPGRLGSLRNMAECEESVGHYASSRRAWLELERGLLVTKDATKYEGWAKDAAEAAARLKPLVAKLRVDVVVTRPSGEGPAQADDGASLTVNGEPVSPSLFGTVLERDPGQVTIVAKAPTATPVKQVVTLTAGSSREVRMSLVLSSPGVHTGPPPPTFTTRTSPYRTAGFVTLGVGVASLAVAGVTLGLRQGALSDLEDQCPGYARGPCPTSVAGIVSRGETASTLTTVFGLAGAAFAGAGLVMVLVSPDEKVRVGGAAGRPRFALTPTPGGAQLTWRFQ